MGVFENANIYILTGSIVIHDCKFTVIIIGAFNLMVTGND